MAHLNVADVQHVILHPNDLREATLTIKADRKSGPPLKLSLLRLLHDVPASASASPTRRYRSRGDRFRDESNLKARVFAGRTLTDVLNQDLKDPSQDHGLLLALDDSAGDHEVELLPVPNAIQGEGSHIAALAIRIRQYPNVSLFPAISRPIPGTYTTVAGGHLSYNGQRLRLWGVCRHFWGGPMVLDRLQKMGFNAIRLWGPRNAYDPASASKGDMIADEGRDSTTALWPTSTNSLPMPGSAVFLSGWPVFTMTLLGIMHKSATNGPMASAR